MLYVSLNTGVLREGDDIAEACFDAAQHDILPNDIIVISSKAVATVEGAMIDLSKVNVTKEAKEWAEKMNERTFGSASTPARKLSCHAEPVEVQHDRDYDAAFRQAVLDECKHWNGRVLGGCPNAMLTELRPDGMERGSLLVPNAGLDRSNVAAPRGERSELYAVGWPREPVESVRRLRRELEGHVRERGKGKGERGGSPSPYPLSPISRIAVILSDSCCRPRRIGVTAFALTVSGIDPLQSNIGKPDLFGKTLRITQEAVADQLATAANMLMGNGDQGIPAVIVRDHGLTLSDFEGWVPGIEPEEDLFRGMI